MEGTYIGLMAAALSICANIPQAYKIYKNKSGEDISWILLSSHMSATVFWLIYAVIFNKLPVIFSSTIVFSTLSSICFMKRKFAKKKVS